MALQQSLRTQSRLLGASRTMRTIPASVGDQLQRLRKQECAKLFSIRGGNPRSLRISSSGISFAGPTTTINAKLVSGSNRSRKHWRTSDLGDEVMLLGCASAKRSGRFEDFREKADLSLTPFLWRAPANHGRFVTPGTCEIIF